MRFTLKLIVSSISVFAFASCEERLSEDGFLELLTTRGPWVLVEAERGHDLTTEFDGLEVRFSGNEYVTSDCTSIVWPAQGEYSLEEPTSRVLVRDDQNEMFIATLDENHLVIQFDFKTFEPVTGRARSVSYSFTFTHPQ